jgi:GAF domain-containing protein
MFVIRSFLEKQVINPIKKIILITKELKTSRSEKTLPNNRYDEIGSLFHSINQLIDEVEVNRENLEPETLAFADHIKTCSDIARFSIKTSSFEKLLKNAVNQIADKFNHYHTAIYMRNRLGDKIILKAFAGKNFVEENLDEISFNIDFETPMGCVIKNNQLHASLDVTTDPVSPHVTKLPETLSQLLLPIHVQDEVIGVFDIQDQEKGAFSQDEISVLQTIVDLISVTIHNFWVLENTRFDPKISAYLFNASYQIISTEIPELIYKSLAETLTRLPFLSAFYTVIDERIQCISFIDSYGKIQKNDENTSISINVDMFEPYLIDHYPINLGSENQLNENFSDEFADFIQQLEYQNLLLYPLFIGNKLNALLFVGTTSDEIINPSLLHAFTKLFDISKISLEKSRLLQEVRKNIGQEQKISEFSSKLSQSIDINKILKTAVLEFGKLPNVLDASVHIKPPDSEST